MSPEERETKKMRIEGEHFHVEVASSSTTETLAINIQKPQTPMVKSSQEFATVRKYPAYVDKSLLIKQVIEYEESTCILLTAPRRFGKSVNLSMIQRFFEKIDDPTSMKQNRELFDKLLLKTWSKFDQYFGKNPVIHLDLKCLNLITTYEEALDVFRRSVHHAYVAHSYLRNSEKIDAPNEVCNRRLVDEWCSSKEFKSTFPTADDVIGGLGCLAIYLRKHFDGAKVVVLVDEYDSVCHKAIMGVHDCICEATGESKTADSIIHRIIHLCIGAIGRLAKGNDKNVDRIIITGISYVMTEGLSDINVIDTFKFQEDHEFTPFYGLEVQEVEQLLQKFNLTNKFEDIKHRYNGYRNEICSIYSVISYINQTIKPNKRQKPSYNFWKKAGVIANLEAALHIPCVKSVILKLMTNLSQEIEIAYFEKLSFSDIVRLKTVIRKEDLDLVDVDIFFNFLLEQGYFAIVSLCEEKSTVVIRIPNVEIKSEFDDELRKFYKSEYKFDFTKAKECASVFDSLNSSCDDNLDRLKTICRLLNEIISSTAVAAKNEATYHHFVYIILYLCHNFKCFSEVTCCNETRNRLDLFLLSYELNFGIVIEFKYCKTSEEALNQIIKKKFYTVFAKKAYNPDEIPIINKLLIGINVSYDQKVTMSVILNYTNDSDVNSEKINL